MSKFKIKDELDDQATPLTSLRVSEVFQQHGADFQQSARRQAG
jgi:hypothetical protein|tara:strand:+ start:1956 stop:2084 length:129 start_codon:yes stop_codon:yes gene_type:complete